MLCAMGELVVTREMLAAKFGSILPHLDERQRRLVLGAEARVLGHGGIRLVAAAAGVSEATGSGGGPGGGAGAGRGPGVSGGAGGREPGCGPRGGPRRPGGGRKPLTETGPGLVPAL